MSYDATFESMEVPEEVKALKKSLVSREEVEMTFKKEKFERLGEATLMNRIQVWVYSLLLIRLALEGLKGTHYLPNIRYSPKNSVL